MTTDVINNVRRELLERCCKRMHDMMQGDLHAELRALLATAQPAADGERDQFEAAYREAVDNGWESTWGLALDIWGKARAALPQQGEYGDAYQGAMEDRNIWKRRALEAEASLREADADKRNAVLATVIRCEQAGAFKTCMECGYQDGHDIICQYHESKRAALPAKAEGVAGPEGLTAITRSMGRAIVRFETTEQLNSFYRSMKAALAAAPVPPVRSEGGEV